MNPPRKIIYASIDPATTRVHLSIDFYPRRLKTDILLTLLGLKREGNVPCRRTSNDGRRHDEDGYTSTIQRSVEMKRCRAAGALARTEKRKMMISDEGLAHAGALI